MTPFLELIQGESALDTSKIDLLTVDSPLRDWRQRLRLTGDVEVDASLPLLVYGGYYPLGKVLLFKGSLFKQKGEEGFVFTTDMPEAFTQRVTMDTTPQAVLKREFEAFGLSCELMETTLRHEVILDGSVYSRVQELALKETPERCWWIDTDGAAWWGLIDESPRWNAAPLWLDSRRDILALDSKGKLATVRFMPWAAGGHCVILDDPVDKRELIQSAVFNVTHQYKRNEGFLTKISYL